MDVALSAALVLETFAHRDTLATENSILPFFCLDLPTFFSQLTFGREGGYTVHTSCSILARSLARVERLGRTKPEKPTSRSAPSPPIPPGKREKKYRQPWIGRGLQLREILHTGKMRNRLPMGVSDAMCPWNGPAGVRYGTMRCVHKALNLIYDLDVAGLYTA